MGKYQAYPEYKDSGVEWLRKVPTHWKVISLKYCVEKIIDNRGRTPPTTDSGIPLLEAKQMGGESIYSQNNFDKYISEEAYSAFIRDDVIENDILFVTVGTVGKTNLVPKDAKYVIAQNIVGLRVRSYMNPLYFLFYLRSNEIKAEMSATNKDSILDSIKISDFIQSNICIPDLIEQQKIANFLDHEIAKIDTLIEQQQQLIQLLKEKRQAVISHAVTKGLNPNAPMKDSGVEWLGEVPAHWDVSSVRRHLLEHKQGYYTTEDYVDTGIKLLRITDLRALGGLSIEDCPRVSANDSLRNFILQEGDVVFARTGGAGSFAVFPYMSEPVVFASYLIRFRFLPMKFNTAFLRYMLSADSFQLAVKQNIHGGVNQNIHAEDIKNTVVTLPPLDEQDEISRYLDEQVHQYAELISAAEMATNFMQERRTALISAAVTGKIDVRNWQAPQQ